MVLVGRRVPVAQVKLPDGCHRVGELTFTNSFRLRLPPEANSCGFRVGDAMILPRAFSSATNINIGYGMMVRRATDCNFTSHGETKRNPGGNGFWKSSAPARFRSGSPASFRGGVRRI